MHSSLGRRRGFAAAIVAVLALVIGMFGLAGPASAAGTHTVTVTVTGSDPSGVGDLTVELYGGSSTYDVYKQTNTSGQAVFTGVPDDTLTAYAYDGRPNAAYSSNSASVTVNNADAAATVPLTAQFHCTGASNAVGSYVVGGTLTAQGPGYANGAPTSTYYTWYRLTVTGAKVRFTTVQASPSATYTLTADDAGHQMEVDVEYYGGSPYVDATCDYNPTPVISLPGTPVTSLPFVTGKAKVGKKVTANVGTVAPGTTVSYQWFRTKKAKHHKVVLVAIKGAHGFKYKLKGKDRGKKVSVAVTYSHPGNNPTTVLSKGKKVK